MQRSLEIRNMQIVIRTTNIIQRAFKTCFWRVWRGQLWNNPMEGVLRRHCEKPGCLHQLGGHIALTERNQETSLRINVINHAFEHIVFAFEVGSLHSAANMKSDKQKAGGSATNACSSTMVPQGVLRLSLGKIHTMHPRELRRLLPQLVSVVKQRFRKKPEWWPKMFPWALSQVKVAAKTARARSVRSVSMKCYNFLAQHTQRASNTPTPPSTQPRVLDWVISHPPNRSAPQPAKIGEKSSPKKPGVPYQDIYLCYLCNEEFATKDVLQKHQVQCTGGALPLSIPTTPPVSEAPSPDPPPGTSDDPGPMPAPSPSPSPTPTPALTQTQFVTALDLVPMYKARKIRQARRRNTECETIDLEEPQTPISPSTPRSHKILITQLSRDASMSSLSGGAGTGSPGGMGSRRSSCLRLSVDKRPDNPASDKEEDQQSDSGESSESNADDPDEPKLKKKSLFNIDVCSALGQRVLKHMTSEIHVPVISDLEQFCRTPIKDKYQDRLRIRQSVYPVTWKMTRKRQQDHCHLYKFTREEKLDFKRTMRTGLNQESRQLCASLNKCSVVVKRVSNATLARWKVSWTQSPLAQQLLKQAKAAFCQPSVFPEGPTFLLTDVDRVLGLKRKNGGPQSLRKLLAGHCVSETDNADLHCQKLTVYRCLLSDLQASATPASKTPGTVPGSVSQTLGRPQGRVKYPALLSILSGSGDHQVPPSNHPTGAQPVDVQKPLKIDIPSPVSGVSACEEKCASVDDSFSVVTGSSDDETDRNGECCVLCTVRNKCRCSPRKDTLVPVPCSPALPSTLSAQSLASLSPPELDPLSLTPKLSLSSHLSLSPPNLSPISQVSETCPPSPASSLRLSTRRSTLLLKTSSSSPSMSCLPKLGSPRAQSVSSWDGLFQLPSAPSPVQGESRADSKAGTKTHRLTGSKSQHRPQLVSRGRNTRSHSKLNGDNDAVNQGQKEIVRGSSVGGSSTSSVSDSVVTSSPSRLATRASSETLSGETSRCVDDKTDTDNGDNCAPVQDLTSTESRFSTPQTQTEEFVANSKDMAKQGARKTRENGKDIALRRTQTKIILKENTPEKSLENKLKDDTTLTTKASHKRETKNKFGEKTEAVRVSKRSLRGGRRVTEDNVKSQRPVSEMEREGSVSDDSAINSHTSSCESLRNGGNTTSHNGIDSKHNGVIGSDKQSKTTELGQVTEETITDQEIFSDLKIPSRTPAKNPEHRNRNGKALQERVTRASKGSMNTSSYFGEQNGEEVNTADTENSNSGVKGKRVKGVTGYKGGVGRRKSSRKSTASSERLATNTDTTQTGDVLVHPTSTLTHHNARQSLSDPSTTDSQVMSSKEDGHKINTSVGVLETKVKKRKSVLTSKGEKQNPEVNTENPFVKSKTRTRQFSSRIKEQARKAWTTQYPSDKKGKAGGLTTGSTFQMASVALDSPSDSVSEGTSRTENSPFNTPSKTVSNTDSNSVSKSNTTSNKALNSGTFTFQPSSCSRSTSPSPSPSSCSGCKSPSPARKGLSPKQMLSVLESTKGYTSPSKVKSNRQSPGMRSGVSLGGTDSSKDSTLKCDTDSDRGSPSKHSERSPVKVSVQGTLSAADSVLKPSCKWVSLEKSGNSRGSGGGVKRGSTVNKAAGKQPHPDRDTETSTPRKKMRV